MGISGVTLMDLDKRAGSRVAWADIAKALSIILLVFWTTIGDQSYVNELLVFARMPLFFFASGLFAYRAVTATSFQEFFRDKFTNLVYLYVLWEVLLFIGRDLSRYVAWGAAIEPERLVSMLWQPIFNQWFLYALAFAFLAAWLVRRVPIWIVCLGVLALYTVSVASGDWRHLPFAERIVRLFPFFWLGLFARPLIVGFIERAWKFWPLALAAFFLAAMAVWDAPLAAYGPVTFVVSLIGIMALLLLSRQLAVLPWLGAGLGVIGASTLYIYVMHKLFLFFAEYAMRFLDVGVPYPGFTLAIAAVVTCAIVGRWMHRQPILGWLFTAPWVGGIGARRLSPGLRERRPEQGPA
ncbi:acyltransferase family protein [soil metagenome]